MTLVRYTNEDRQKVAGMLAEGQPYSAIAKAVGRSRSSVAGLIMRFPELRPGVPSRPKVSVEASRKQGGIRGGKPAKLLDINVKKRAKSPRGDGTFKDRSTPAPQSRMVCLAELEPRQCKFPIGDPRDEAFRFCGADARRGPYCDHHYSIAYTGFWRPAA